MSFLVDRFLPGRHYPEEKEHGEGTYDKPRLVKKSQSSGGLLSPLVRLARGPREVLGELLPEARSPSEDGTKPGQKAYLDSRKQVLYLRLKETTTYEEWLTAARALDGLEGNDEWKYEDVSAEYDWHLVQARLKQLDDARISCNVKHMLFLVRTALTRGLGGMGDLRLYKHSHTGTKRLIERYIESVQATINALLEISAKEKEENQDERNLLEELLRTRQAFGRSALLLSGGGTFGMNHIGVIKTLWETKLLPRIISGASAGSIISAVLCTKTDAEIPDVMKEFCYGDLEVFEKDGEPDGVLKKAARFLKFGALFDISHLVGVMQEMLGDLTFQEAYNRTRRILNITVSAAGIYELPRLLNYVTAPNVIIWSAVAASCSVPFIFQPFQLRAKDPKTGKEVPWNPSPQRWIDGSVDNDLPMTRLAEMFNVNHFIVSQVNPHVVPFLVKEEDTVEQQARDSSTAFAAGPTWLNSMATLAKHEALHRLHVMSEMGIFPNTLTKARSVLSQKYSGDITIFPQVSYSNFPRVLSNPDTEFMLQAMVGGEKATWPKLSRIQNHLAIELALDDAVRKLRARVAFSPSQVDLRMTAFGRPTTSQCTPRSLKRTANRPPIQSATMAKPELSLPSEYAYEPRRSLHFPFDDQASHMLDAAPKRKRPRSSQLTFPTNPLSPDCVKISSSEALSSSPDDNESSDVDDTASFSSDDSPPSTSPGLWPSTRPLFPSSSQPSTPSMASASASRSSLHMTSQRTPTAPIGQPTLSVPASSTTPSSPEMRYKRLFHGKGEPTGIPPTPPSTTEQVTPKKSHSRRGSRNSLGLDHPAGLQIDLSGTRGMVLRRKQSSNASMREKPSPSLFRKN